MREGDNCGPRKIMLRGIYYLFYDVFALMFQFLNLFIKFFDLFAFILALPIQKVIFQPLLLLKNFLFCKFFILSFVIQFFQGFNICLVILLFYFNLTLSLSLKSLLQFLIFPLFLIQSLSQNFTLLFFTVQFSLKLVFLLLELSYVCVFDCLDDLVKLFVLSLFGLSQLTESSLLQLNLICIIFFYSLSFNFML